MTPVAAQAVLFDMDGTLVDSNALVDVLWTTFADELGLDAAEVLRYAHGRPSRDTIARYLDDDQAIVSWMDRIHAMESSDFDGVIEIPGARALTASLPRDRWAVVTSALREPATARLRAVGIEPPPVLVGADDVEHGKPDPAGYAGAARALGFLPSDCVVFEDTEAGVQAGLAAGCAVVVVGDLTSHAAEDLPRVRDMAEVSVRVEDDGLTITVGS